MSQALAIEQKSAARRAASGYANVEVAKYIVQQHGGDITHLHLQKTLYIAYMLYLGEYGTPLVRGDSYQAWRLGPVLPGLYHLLSHLYQQPVGVALDAYQDMKKGRATETLDLVGYLLKNLTTGQLVSVTHAEWGAWHKNYDERARATPIPDADILEEYQEFTKRYGGE